MKCPQCNTGDLREMTWQEAYPATSGIVCTDIDCQRVYLGWGSIHQAKLEFSPTFKSAKETRGYSKK